MSNTINYGTHTKKPQIYDAVTGVSHEINESDVGKIVSTHNLTEDAHGRNVLTPKTPFEMSNPKLAEQQAIYQSDPAKYTALFCIKNEMENNQDLMRFNREIVTRPGTNNPALAVKTRFGLEFFVRSGANGQGGHVTFPDNLNTMTANQLNEFRTFLTAQGISDLDMGGLNDALKNVFDQDYLNYQASLRTPGATPTREPAPWDDWYAANPPSPQNNNQPNTNEPDPNAADPAHTEFDTGRVAGDNTKGVEPSDVKMETFLRGWIEGMGKKENETYTFNFFRPGYGYPEFCIYDGKMKDNKGNIKAPLMSISFQQRKINGTNTMVVGFSCAEGKKIGIEYFEKLVECMKDQGYTSLDLSSIANQEHQAMVRLMCGKHGIVPTGCTINAGHHEKMMKEAIGYLSEKDYLAYENRLADHMYVNKNPDGRNNDLISKTRGSSRLQDFANNVFEYKAQKRDPNTGRIDESDLGIAQDLKKANESHDGVKIAAISIAAADILNAIIDDELIKDMRENNNDNRVNTNILPDKYAALDAIYAKYGENATARSISDEDFKKIYKINKEIKMAVIEKDYKEAGDKIMNDPSGRAKPTDATKAAEKVLSSYNNTARQSLSGAIQLTQNKFSVTLKGVSVASGTYKGQVEFRLPQQPQPGPRQGGRP